ncbi:MAG: hypothetical protein JWL94_104 [Microbacteriaceae bacterium]|jgi:hypothetical protein|nr:hypothetical protein [Microbacteriaceae bacterium]
MEDLIAWAEGIGLRPTVGHGDDIVRVEGAGLGFAIAEHHELFPVEAELLGRDRIVLGVFEDVEDARRFLTMEIGVLMRHQNRMPPLAAHRLPPGFVLEQAPTALWLAWLTGSAEFPTSAPSRIRALNFSRVERAPLERIQSSFLEPHGLPLYDVA